MSKLYYPVKPAIWFEPLFFMFRFRLIGNKLERVGKKMKLIVLIVSVIFVLANVVILSSVKNYITRNSGDMDNVFRLAAIIPSTLIFIEYVILINITCLINSDENLKLFENLNKIDTTLICTKVQEKYYNNTKYGFIIGGVYVFAVDLLYSINSTEEMNLAFELIKMIIGFFTHFESIFFCVLVHMMQLRLNILNEHLARTVKRKEKARPQVFVITNQNIQREKDLLMMKRLKLCDLAFVYELIGETYDCLNNVFNFHVLMTIVTNFTYMVISIWTSLYYYRKYAPTVVFNVLSIIWGVTGFSHIMLMCFMCSKVLSAREKTQTLIMEIVMDYNIPNTLRRQAKSFLILVDAWPLQIIVYDMICVDVTLILKYLSVATTYLIIMIQVSHFL